MIIYCNEIYRYMVLVLNRVCAHMNTCTYLHMYTHAHVHTCTCTYMHMYIHAHVHTCIHVHHIHL